jgi:catalase (peroxidase I)
VQFHDSLPFDTRTKRGGANGSIRMETSRGENFGLERAVSFLRPIQDVTNMTWGDIVALAGARAVAVTGGPVIDVPMGRVTADTEDPKGILPSPSNTVDELRATFVPRGLSDMDIVALSGAHTLGRVGGAGPFDKDPNTFENKYVWNFARLLFSYQNVPCDIG